MSCRRRRHSQSQSHGPAFCDAAVAVLPVVLLLLLQSMVVLVTPFCPQPSSSSSSSSVRSASFPAKTTWNPRREMRPPPRGRAGRGSSSPSVRDVALGATTTTNQFYTQVVSDVDDTLKSSGGVSIGGIALGGVDVQYARGDFYPGVGEFMLSLSRHNLPSGETIPPKLAILTARAEEFKSVLEIKPTSKLAVALRRAGESVGIDGWGVGPVLYGSVAEWIDQTNKGLRKFTNFEKLLRQDPAPGGTSLVRYVYVGDTGELDMEAGEAMLREYPDLVQAVFLHVVTDDPDGPSGLPSPKLVRGRPVIFFRTYVGAASDAVRLGLMTRDGLRSVRNAAVRNLTESGVPETSSKWTDLRTDLARAEAVLLSGGDDDDDDYA